MRYSKWGRFTKDFHFIDAKDSPPSYCGIDYQRDCKKDSGCVVSALANYTNRLLDADLSPGERAVAAKFVIHFVSDMHQPLHTEDIARGGNGISVLFDGVRLNLHHVWDTSIPEKMVGGVRRKPYEEAKRWAGELTDEIKKGKFADERLDWLQAANLSDPINTALAWAGEGNAYVCTTGEFLVTHLDPPPSGALRFWRLTCPALVLPQGKDGVVDQELGGEYYENAVPVIESQVAKAGYRLAAWLDLIVANLKSRPSKGDL